VRAAQPQDTARDSLLVSDSIYQGWKWFHVYCFRCHGEDAIGGVNPSAPDLRWALSARGANFPRDSFVYTVLNGRLDKGMPAWKAILDTSAIYELYQYVKARSDGWLKPGRPHRLSDLEGAPRHLRDLRAVPVRQGAERRLAQAGPAAPALRPGRRQEPVSARGPGRRRGAGLAAALAGALLSSALPHPAPAQQRLTRDHVLAA